MKTTAIAILSALAISLATSQPCYAKEKGVLEGIGEVFEDMGKGIKKLFNGSGKNEGKKEATPSQGTNDEKMKKTVNDAYKKLTTPGK